MRKISDKVDAIQTDTEHMLEWFYYHLDIVPTHFCFPYNIYCPIYKGLLEKTYGFTTFYGSERIDIESLI